MLALLSFLLAPQQFRRVANLFDFAAFYCGGSAIAEHHDPYRTEPQRTCWNATRGFPPGQGVPFAVPAPLPGYALAPFVFLSRMPFPAAAALWVTLLLGSFALTVVLLRRLCDCRIETIFAAMLLNEGIRSIFLGQVVPVVCAATVAAGLLVSRGRDRAAALAATVAMLEPHLGLPVCLALFIARPRSRAVMAICGAALALISFEVLGVDGNLEYFRDIIPAHALSEVSNEEQYSLTYLAHLAGLGEHAASLFGTLSYVAMLAAGIVAGRLAAARTGAPALFLLVPPAFAVFGGPFVHVQQLAIAIPAALVLSSARLPGTRLSAVAVFLLAVPYGALTLLGLGLPLVAGVTFVLALDLFELPPVRSALVSAVSVGTLVAILSSLVPRPTPIIGPLDQRDGRALAADGWRTHVEATFHSNPLQYNLAKIPGWCGLLLIVLVSSGSLSRLKRTPREAERDSLVDRGHARHFERGSGA
jgi:hypothetical protein